jgi:glucan phosphoethanolaminetransferase (alkaline phosphatase superfamily)
MEKYKYYTQEGNRYTLKVQKGLFIIAGLLICSIAIVLFTIKPDAVNILMGVVFLALGALVFLRITSSTIIDTASRQVIFKSFSFSKPMHFEFKDYEGFNNTTISNYGVKGTSLLGLRFNVNGKAKEVRLRQGFMSTKGLHEVLKETEQIMGI